MLFPDEIGTSMKTTKVLFGILSITMALAVHAQAQTFLTNGFVAYYPFNGNVNDASGNGNNGTIENGLTFVTNRFSEPSSAALFSGSNYVSVPNSPTLSMTTAVSVSAWIFPNVPSQIGGLVGKWSLGKQPQFLLVFSPRTTEFIDWDIFTANPGEQELLTPLAYGTWVHIVGVWDGAMSELYVNGVLLSNRVTTGTIVVDNGPLEIGRYANAASYYNGAIDDVRIYNRALSTNEVQQLYAFESRPIVALRKAVSPSFSNLYLGTNYQLQISTDLSTWTNSGAAFAPTNTVMAYPQYWDVDNWNSLYFRLQVAP